MKWRYERKLYPNATAQNDGQMYILSLHMTRPSSSAMYFQLWQIVQDVDMRVFYIEIMVR